MHRSNIITVINTTRSSIARRAYPPVRHSSRNQSTARSGGPQHRVDTPVQSQATDQLVPAALKPGSQSGKAQTPIQSQNAADFSPLASSSTRPPLNNTGPLFVLFAGLVTVPIILYTYYEHRKEHMDQKWEGMLKDAQRKQQQG